MRKKIEIHQRNIEYTLKVSKKAQRMRLAVYCDSSLVVTVPKNIDISLIEKFIIEKSKWIVDKLEYFQQFSDKVFTIGTDEQFFEYKEKALILAEQRIAYFNKIYKFKFNKVNIKNQKTRWGSCSRKGNLNFNYKIALVPKRLSDYIVVHELCHLGEFNHSQKFWNLVGKGIPDYLEIKKEMKNSEIRFS